MSRGPRTSAKSTQMLVVGVALLIVVGALVAYQYVILPSQGCQSTSCQQVSQSYQAPSNQGAQTTTTAGSTTTTAATQNAQLLTGMVYLDVWANFTDGTSQHFSSSQAYSQQWSSIQIGGKTVKSFTLQLTTQLLGLPPNPSYSGSLLFYTCGACGNQQVNLTAIPINSQFTHGVVTSFPSLQATKNLTLLVWPNLVISGGSGAAPVTIVLGMPPLAISASVPSTQTTTTTSSTPNYPAVATLYTVPLSCIEPGSTNCASYTTTSLMNVYQAANALGGVASCTPSTPSGCAHLMALYTPLPSGTFVHTASATCAQAIVSYGYNAMPYSGSTHATSTCSDLTSGGSIGSGWYSFGYYGPPGSAGY